METPRISETTRKLLLGYQINEETDHIIYSKMADREKDEKNRAVLRRIANEERVHAEIWAKYTGERARPKRLRALWLSFLSVVMGYTFVLKLMEKGEYDTGKSYGLLRDEIPEALTIMEEEQAHEEALMGLLDEERLQYVGAMVLGLNDALVELTGTIAGLTFALASTKLVALSGIITGASATLSMAASNYLAEKADGNPKALKSSVYTGVAYLVTVVLLVLPYLLFPTELYVAAFVTMLAVVVLIILFFNYYISVAKDEPFLKRFGEMAGISLGVAAVAFVIGLLAKRFLGIDI
ncbi:VIT1/CCC1 family protein [Oscillospiraceae bacterium OttesenSCG-928-G22]|nr:VIT1/CCC1 family protein [Oscillospiraceae bacterium OttesenSCG-928-G22]